MASHISRANSKAVLLRQCQDTKLGNATLASLQLGCKCGQGARWFVLMPDYGQQPVIAVWPRSLERFKAKVASCTQLDRAEPVFQVPQLQLPGPLFLFESDSESDFACSGCRLWSSLTLGRFVAHTPRETGFVGLLVRVLVSGTEMRATL